MTAEMARCAYEPPRCSQQAFSSDDGKLGGQLDNDLHAPIDVRPVNRQTKMRRNIKSLVEPKSFSVVAAEP